MAEFESVVRSGITKACQGAVPPRTRMHLYVAAATALGVSEFPNWLRKPIGRLITNAVDSVVSRDLVKAGGAYRLRQIGSGTEEGVEAPSRKGAHRNPSPLTPASEAFGGEIVRSRR